MLSKIHALLENLDRRGAKSADYCLVHHRGNPSPRGTSRTNHAQLFHHLTSDDNHRSIVDVISPGRKNHTEHAALVAKQQNAHLENPLYIRTHHGAAAESCGLFLYLLRRFDSKQRQPIADRSRSSFNKRQTCRAPCGVFVFQNRRGFIEFVGGNS